MTTEILKNIYKIKSYSNAPKTQKAEQIENLSYLESQLKEDNNLNEIYFGDNIIKLVIDYELKGTEIKEIISCLERYFYNNFHINIKYSFTENKKKFNGPGSYHIIITNICATVSNIKILMSDFNNKYSDYKVDLSIYKDGRNILRLPNQTTKDVEGKIKQPHKIIKGEILDFYLMYIKNAINIDDYKYINILKESETEQKSKLNPKQKTENNNDINNNSDINNNNDTNNIYDDIILNSYITENNKYVITLLKILTNKTLNDYYKWILVGQVIKSLNIDNGAEIYEEISKKSLKYKINEPIKKYNSFHKNKYSLGTLIYLCKEDNPEEFEKINETYLYTSIFEEDKFLSTKMHQEYLINNNDDKFLLNHFNEFINDNNINSFCLKSTYNTGKTQLINNLLTTYNPNSVLFVSYRKSLSADLLHDFEHLNVKSYLDNNLYAPRLICQLESLPRLQDYYFNMDMPIKYDWIILDESESLLNHFNSTTVHQKRKIYKLLSSLIRIKGTKLIAMDGDFSNRSFDFIKQFGAYKIIENTIKKNIKNFIITSNDIKFMNNIFNDVDNNKNIVIVSMSATQASKYEIILKDKYPTKNILLYTGLTDDNIKKEHFENVTEFWSKSDIIIYSPTVESGVNFNMEHIHHIYGIFSTGSTSQRAFFQMLARTRQTKDNNILILNPKIPEKTSAHYYTYNEVKDYDMDLKKDVEKVKEIDDEGNIIFDYDNYDINYIYNRVEELNKNKCYFMAVFYQMAIKKGHTVEFEKNDDSKFKEILSPENDKYLDITEKEIAYNDVVTAIDITDINVFLKKQKKGTLTKDEKIQMGKYYFKLNFGFDIIDIEILEKYYKKDYIIKNTLALLSLDNIYNIEEKDIKKQQTKIVDDLIKDTGFDNAFDDKIISAETFFKNAEYTKNNNVIFTESNKSRSFFNMAKKPKEFKTENNRTFIEYVNSYLRPFNIKISGNYKEGRKREAKNMEYKLVILNNVQEIIEIKKEKGHIIYDSKNIFKPIKNEEKIFKHLIIKTELIKEMKSDKNNDMFNDP